MGPRARPRSRAPADIFHRDLHPENVLRVDGRWVVADWGVTIARGHKRLTRTRSAGGNELWIAPEQLRSLKDATVRSDLYSLGRLVEWLASGELPNPLRPGTLSDGHPLGSFVAAATQLDANNRPPSVEEALRLIPSAAATAGPAASPKAPRQALPTGGRPRPPAVPDTIGLSKFMLICGMAKHGSGNTEEFHAARTEANALHAHLVGGLQACMARYFTATAYTVFCLRGDHDRRKAERVEEARETVEALLRDPSSRSTFQPTMRSRGSRRSHW